MAKRSRWIAVALASFVGGTALAQQTDDAEPRSTQSDQAQPPMQQPQPTEAQLPAEPDPRVAVGDAGRPQSSRLSQIEGDGVRLSQLDREQITALQEALEDAGYYTAEVDGIVGPKTKQALRQFYSDQAQLAARGVILPQGAAALGLDQAEIERVRGEDQGQLEEPMRTPGAADDTTDAMPRPQPDTTRQPQPSSPAPSPGPPEPVPQTGSHSHDMPGTMR
jgi:hypothetical protein